MKERKFSFHVQGGISLILLVFVVLSLLSFACLSIVSALSDLRQSRRFEERTAAYYRAYTQAQEYLYELYEEGENSDEVMTKVFPVDEDENLILQYRLSGCSVELIGERIEHIGPEEPDTSLSVMGGQGD